MTDHINDIDATLAELRTADLSPAGWSYLAAEAVRWLNHATLSPSGYAYPAEIYSVIGNLQTLSQRLPQALHQAAGALEAMQDAGHVQDVTNPDRTDVSVLTVTESLAYAAGHADTVARELTSAQVPAGRLAYHEPSSHAGAGDNDASASGAGDR